MNRPAFPNLPANHPTVPSPKVGVLLINLGTPTATDYWSVRRYLKQFLSDRRVIDTNRFAWWFILNGIILSIRPQRSGAAYASIWNRELNESPLRTITRSQSEKLADRFSGLQNVSVDWAMRYGTPSIESRLKAMCEAGCQRISLIALYPQYAAATTATAYDDAFSALQSMRWQPAIRTAAPYHDHPLYIKALADSIRSDLAGLSWKPEAVLASFHGLPKRYLELGDPYHCHCQKTARLLTEALGVGFPPITITFQSRFGREEWLQPYTEPTLIEMAKSGIKRVAVVTPGFSADCIETLEEIAMEAKEAFIDHGGEEFRAIPCLNDSEGSMDLIEAIVKSELAGWVDY